MEEERCENCKYYDGDAYCRRYPPVVTQAVSTSTTDGCPSETYSYLESTYPTVNAGEWCGEYKKEKKDGL